MTRGEKETGFYDFPAKKKRPELLGEGGREGGLPVPVRRLKLPGRADTRKEYCSWEKKSNPDRDRKKARSPLLTNTRDVPVKEKGGEVRRRDELTT